MSDKKEKKTSGVDTSIYGTFTNKNSTPKIEDRETDLYYKLEKKLPESNVAIPTYDAVVEAKEWVDDENKK